MKERERRINLGNQSVRGRLSTRRYVPPQDIGRVWHEQKKLTEERWKLGPEDKSIFEDAKKKLIRVVLKTKKRVHHRVSFKGAKNLVLLIKTKIKSKPKTYSAIGLAVIALLPIFLTMGSSKRTDEPKSLGVAVEASAGSNDGKTDEKPSFSILHPNGKEELLEVTRKTPTGVLLHTYRDTVEGAEVEVTQQELPESFKSSPTAELEKMAKNFQATDIIQIDEAFVYHGLDEKTRVQSLFTIKNNVLISIRSNVKLSDDTWAGYILSLQ